MKAIKLTFENYKTVENCTVIDDNGTEVEIGNQVEIFTVSDENNQHSHDFISFDNDKTIQYTHKGCFYVSECDLKYELELYKDDAKGGAVDTLWSKEIKKQINKKLKKTITINDLKKELNLTNAEIADLFGLSAIAYANSSAKSRYETALCRFYERVKEQRNKPEDKNN